MPKIAALGGLSSRGFGEFAQPTAATYIEDVFSTYLYTGNGSTQTITNGIDLSGKGGLVWLKSRSAATDNVLYDTVRGATKQLISNNTLQQTTQTTGLTSFLANGFNIGSLAALNTLSATYASWAFTKQSKFFDVVTYTGNGASLNISHSLNSVPGMIIVRCVTVGSSPWRVYHKDYPTGYGTLNSTDAFTTFAASGVFGNGSTVVAPTATQFTVGTSLSQAGATYIAYVFAHNAGGFGADGSQNVISCGSFTTDGIGNATVTLGYEPQFVIVKTLTVGAWSIFDVMRGFSQTQSNELNPNYSAAETANSGNYFVPTATGFTTAGWYTASTTVLYLAIRRGPMKTPTDATKVFKPIIYTGDGTATKKLTTDFPVDLGMLRMRSVAGSTDNMVVDRLRGIGTASPSLYSASTGAEGTANYAIADNVSYQLGNGTTRANNTSSTDYIAHFFRRAPGFFDVVCYSSTLTGTQFANINHNLSAVPELIFVKGRSGPSSVDYWAVYSASVGNTKALLLNDPTGPVTNSTYWNNTTPTSSVFTIGANSRTGADQTSYVAYLFATCPGVSKVGSYTGTGATQTISCGFTGGARYVLIKRTDSTGSWYVWDSARGMVAGTDPSLLLNSTAAEVNANSIYTTTGGFQIVSTAADINASGGTYIYLAIA